MCGICGIYHYTTEQPVEAPLLQRMTVGLAHRGPDDEGVFLDGPVGLGHRRLAIIDTAGGHQPIANEDESVWAVVNGEIYNFRQLADDQRRRGHHFRTHTDSEVVVHAYEESAIDCVQHLDGMYALAVWDRRARRLLLARDPFGIKPLYVWDDGRCLRFASEIKAFLADPAFPRDVDFVALDQYLTLGFVPSPRTLFSAVRKIAPGHRMVVEHGRVRVEPFTHDTPRPAAVPDERAAVAELQDHLIAAVRRQMVSDVPVGALLSGGVDSATVVALMREVGAQSVQTFTVGFAGHFAQNELTAARRTAALLGTDHHEVVMDAQDCLDTAAAVVWHLDEPIATPSAIPMYRLSQLAAAHVKVVLTGQGADEPWAGYRRYRGEKFGTWYRRLPRPLRDTIVTPLVARLSRAEDLKRALYALGADQPARRFARVYALFTEPMKQALYRPERRQDGDGPAVDAVRYWQEQVTHLEPLAQQLFVEARLSLPDNLLTYGDKMAMAFSLEARVPLLDTQLMRFVEGLPVDLRLKGWAGHKHLYRAAIRRWLPDELLRRPKIGFLTPMDQWFQGPLAAPLRERLAAPGSACARYFNVGYIGQMIGEHTARRQDHTRTLFSLLMFEGWHAQFVDAAPPAR